MRRALARGLHQIVETARPFVASSPLAGRAWAVPADLLWPVPHSKLFDFDATAAGAEWIDQIARAARAIEPAGDLVIGHMDWRAEHVRFDGGAVVVAYDWDSLDRTREPVLIGSAAHGFRADWSREGRRQAPTLEEARAFIDAYADARVQLRVRAVLVQHRLRSARHLRHVPGAVCARRRRVARGRGVSSAAFE